MTRTVPTPRLCEHPAGRPERGVTVRAIDDADATELCAFYARLSPDSRRLRFFGTTVVTRRQATAFATADGHRRQGFVAVLNEDGPRDGRIVGHLCLEPAGERAMEVAVAVEDAFQRRGIGRRLLAAAIGWAQDAGVPRLQASMFIGNTPIRRLLAGAGLPHQLLPVDAGLLGMEIHIAGVSGERVTIDPARPLAS